MQSTFPQLLLKHASERPDAPAMREKIFGIWQTRSWQDMATLVAHVAGGLHLAGLQRGEHMVLIGSNRPRLYATMLAIQSLGAIPVPLYQDAAGPECVFPINNTGTRFAMVEDQEQVDKLLEIRAACPAIGHIYYDEPRGLRNYSETGLASLDSLIEAGKAFAASNPGFFKAEIAKAVETDVAAMFYTSGTTGNPKGVVHTHFTLLNRGKAAADFDHLGPNEDVLAYLPPAWIGQNIFSYAQWLACGYVVNCPESAATVTIDLKEVGPTYYFAPPRVFEGLLTSVMIRMEDAGTLKRKMFEACMSRGQARGPGADGRRGRERDRPDQVHARRLHGVRPAAQQPGAQPRQGGLHRRRGHWPGPVHLLPLHWHQHEAVVRLDRNRRVRLRAARQPGPRRHRGRAARRRGDQGRRQWRADGQVARPAEGVLQNPEATAEVLTADGWYHTGDAGFLDNEGHLKIIDRAKDVGRIMGGPNDGAMFAPKYVENKLKFFSHIKEVVALGDKREYACVMVNIDLDAVANWAERRNLPYAGYADLAQKPEVYGLIKECVEQVNADLSRDAMLSGSQVSRFLVLHKELDADDGELTRTNKVRRGFIAEKYKPLVDALYGGKTEQYIETQVKFEDGRTGSINANLKIVDVKTFKPVKAAA